MPNVWKNTLANYNYPGIYYPTNTESPECNLISGDGTVCYILYMDNDLISRQKYNRDSGTWTSEIFSTNLSYFQSYNITGGKLLPNAQYRFPVATSADGNTLVFAKQNISSPYYNGPTSKSRTIIITKYVNGQFIQVGSEITFTPQSNFNTATNTVYNIQRVFLSENGLKLVLLTQGGINTFVCTNDTWTLIPATSDITVINFPYRDWIFPAQMAHVSKNGMYLALCEDSPPIDYGLTFTIFKFDTAINNWVLFKTINQSYGIYQSFISNTGVLVMYHGQGSLVRYEYNPTTEIYELKTNTSYVLTRGWDSHTVFMSADCNTYVCRYRYLGNSNTEQFQTLRVLKYSNGAWSLHNPFPETFFPYKTVINDQGYGVTVLGISSDGGTIVTRQFFGSVNNQLGNVYVYMDVPELILGLGGSVVSIQDANVDFTTASTAVKMPTLDLNVVNKIYVDNAGSEIQALIIQDNSYNEQCTAKKQEIQSNLATQIEQLYQYFFNQSRTEPILR